MLLIEDHSRMQLHSSTPYASTHDQQHRLLRSSHREDWHSASEEFRRGDYLQAVSDQPGEDAEPPAEG